MGLTITDLGDDGGGTDDGGHAGGHDRRAAGRCGAGSQRRGGNVDADGAAELLSEGEGGCRCLLVMSNGGSVRVVFRL